jgi:chromosome segregation ATPase
MLLWLVGSAIWQAQRLARQDGELKLLHQRIDSFRNATIVAGESQHDVETAVRHLISSDPVESISLLQKRFAEAEKRTVLQASRNVSADMNERLEEIRHGQQELRKQLAEVIEKRRTIEPVFGELKERQEELERSLAEAEVDENQNSFASRMKRLTEHMMQTRTRMKALQDSFVTLNQFKDELDSSKASLALLQAPEAGIEFLIAKARVLYGELFQAIEKLESDGSETLAARVEALAKGKTDTEQRIARLNECFATLDAIRRDFEELKERQGHLERSLADVEVDADGKTLAGRLNALNEFVAQTRVRLRVLQDSLVTLTGFKDELDLSKASLVPLQAPEGGIEFVIGKARAVHGELFQAIEKLESDGNETLAARVDALAKGKIDTEQRIARLNECFTTLDAIRRNFEELKERQGHLERSLFDVEVDADGKTLAGRLNALNEFAAQTRARLRVLQDSLVTLSGFKDELQKSQVELAPLHAPADGIDALAADAHALRDQLVATLDKLESSGGETLTARVEALAKSKLEIENRIAGAVDCFAKLDTIRADIGGLFAKLSIAIDKHTS